MEIKLSTYQKFLYILLSGNHNHEVYKRESYTLGIPFLKNRYLIFIEYSLLRVVLTYARPTSLAYRKKHPERATTRNCNAGAKSLALYIEAEFRDFIYTGGQFSCTEVELEICIGECMKSLYSTLNLECRYENCPHARLPRGTIVDHCCNARF